MIADRGTLREPHGRGPQELREEAGHPPRLAVQNPDIYQPPWTLNNLGLLNCDEDRKAEVRKNYEEALIIYREFAARGPATYQLRVERVGQNPRDLDPVSP